jgi:hypothetical protein
MTSTCSVPRSSLYREVLTLGPPIMETNIYIIDCPKKHYAGSKVKKFNYHIIRLGGFIHAGLPVCVPLLLRAVQTVAPGLRGEGNV